MPRTSHRRGPRYACFSPEVEPKARSLLFSPSGIIILTCEKAFGVKMDTLLRMQASYDIAQTRKRENEIHVRLLHQLAEVRA